MVTGCNKSHHGSCLVFTPVSNPLTLHCDHFDHGSDQVLQSWCEPVDLAMVYFVVTFLVARNCDVTINWPAATATLPYKVKMQHVQTPNIIVKDCGHV